SYADRLSFKERRELEALEAELPELERQKTAIETELSSGMLSPEKLQESSKRIVELMEEIELKTLRWMELSEKN
ncbi:MAG: ABC transporter ATP-binding protein, partial [Alistipes sp.]|nr:ABC transporter ATP-binding protein [Alistipes sp.]